MTAERQAALATCQQSSVLHCAPYKECESLITASGVESGEELIRDHSRSRDVDPRIDSARRHEDEENQIFRAALRILPGL